MVLLGTSLAVNAAITASDSFDAGGLSGGTNWDANWVGTGSGGEFSSTLDGNALGAYTSGGSREFNRSISPTQGNTGDMLTVGISFRSDLDIIADDSDGGRTNEIGVSFGDTGGNLVTVKFVEGTSSGAVLFNDGGSFFTPTGSTIAFSEDAIYDVTFASVIGSSSYDLSITERGGSESASVIGATFNGADVTSDFGSMKLFFTAPDGGGNDARFDNASVVVVVPEPSSAALLGLGGLALIMRRRK